MIRRKFNRSNTMSPGTSLKGHKSSVSTNDLKHRSDSLPRAKSGNSNKRPDSARSKNLSQTEKIQMVLSSGNFFGDGDDGNSEMVEQLQARNRRLKKRVDKLQTINNTLKTDMSKVQRDNAKVKELKDE